MAKVTNLLVDRLRLALPNAATIVGQHDIDIPEGYLAEIWGAEWMCTGFLDTGGICEAYLSLDEDIITEVQAMESDDVIFASAFETLLVTTGGGMVVAADRVFFRHPFLTAHSIVQWIIQSVTNWSAAQASFAVFYRLRKATKEDIVEQLLRRR